jgi:PAS domain S-box-containing protein
MNNSTQKQGSPPSEAKVQGKSDLLELLFKHTLDCVVILDSDFNFVRVNEAYAKACKRNVKDFPGRNHFELYPSDAKEIFENVVKTKQPFKTSACPYVFCDQPEWGKTYWDWTLVPVLDDDGEVEFLIFTLRDITERKLAEEELLHNERQLRSLASQLSLAEEHERQKLAAGLHDSVGQQLAFLKIGLDLLKRNSAPYPDIDSLLDEVIKTTEKVILETRSLAFEICPPFLHERGFEQTLEWFGGQLQKKHGIAFKFIDDSQYKPLGDDSRTLLFRTVRELLINVVKHAHASKVKATTRKIDHCIQIVVEDNGVGFDILKTSLNADNDNFSLGLFSIRERLRHLGGAFDIESGPDRGTKVTLKLPLKQQ